MREIEQHCLHRHLWMTCRGKRGAPNLSSQSAGNNLVGPTQPAIPVIGDMSSFVACRLGAQVWAPRLPLHVIQRCLCKQRCSISLMTTYCTEIRSMKTLEAHALYFLRFFCETDCGRYNALSTCYATLLPKSNFASTPCVCMRACVCSANK